MPFKKLSGVFSRRRKNDPKPLDALTPTFRNRVMMLCHDSFPADLTFGADYFWKEIHHTLRYHVGRGQLAPKEAYPSSMMEDNVHYLTSCTDVEFLDFVELIFHTQEYSSRFSRYPNDHLVDAINEAFRFDDLPYSLTEFSRETKKVTVNIYGSESEVDTTEVLAYPRVIRREDEVPHNEAIEPALALLRGKGFASANKEFLGALADYRKGDFGGCLTKCGSAFESTMKVICEKKTIPYDASKDTAAPLIKKLIAEGPNLDNFFEQTLTIVATLRNRLSDSHGAGAGKREVPRHLAKYTINATAAAILLLVEEFRP